MKIGVFQACRFITKCYVPQMDFNKGVPSARISWWILKIPTCVWFVESRWFNVSILTKFQIPPTFSQMSGLASRFIKDWPKTFSSQPQKKVTSNSALFSLSILIVFIYVRVIVMVDQRSHDASSEALTCKAQVSLEPSMGDRHRGFCLHRAWDCRFRDHVGAAARMNKCAAFCIDTTEILDRVIEPGSFFGSRYRRVHSGFFGHSIPQSSRCCRMCPHFSRMGK